MKYPEEHYKISKHRSCSTLKIYRSPYRRHPKRDEQALKEIASTRIKYGYRRTHMPLKREGWETTTRESIGFIGKQNAVKRTHLALLCCRSMDFISYQLFNGKRFRGEVLTDFLEKILLKN